MGVVVGIWHFGETQGDLPGDELSAIATIARQLEAATGLRVEMRRVIGWGIEQRRLAADWGLPDESHTLCIPALREELFGWTFMDRTLREEWIRDSALRDEQLDCAFSDRTVMVNSFMPGRPYLWENLDAVMAADGGRRSTAGFGWHPNPAHARLRTRWDTLPRDRFLLAMPSLLGARPFDRLLSLTAR